MIKGGFGRAIEVSPDLILVHDGQQIVYANPALMRAFGLSSGEQILGHSPLELLHPDDRIEAAYRNERVLQTQQTTTIHELRWMRPDGIPIEGEAVHIPMELGETPGVLVILRDSSRRKQAEA